MDDVDLQQATESTRGDLNVTQQLEVAAALVRRKQRDSKAGGTRKKSAPLRFSSRTDLLSAGPAGRGRARDRQAGASAPSALGAEAGPGQQAEADRRAALVRCLEVLESLPAGSSYARHRRRVVGKALQLLEVVRSERSAEQEAELLHLLGELQL